MSTPTKTSVLRAILPNEATVKTIFSRETPSKVESETVTLSTERVPTETLVNRIKELSKLRDEIVLLIRHLAIPREPGSRPTTQFNYEDGIASIREEMDEARDKYQGVQDRIDNTQKQIDDSKKLISAFSTLSDTGFSIEQLTSEVGDYRRVFGRIPVKKLETAQKAIQNQLKDQGILAIGKKGKETAYLLIATPKDKSAQALQTLLLSDFAQVDIPEIGSKDPKAEIQSLNEKLQGLTKELDDTKHQRDDIRDTSGKALNRRLDEVSDSLLLLRGTLKLGEGAQASRIYSRFEKPLPEITLNELSKRGVFELETLS